MRFNAENEPTDTHERAMWDLDRQSQSTFDPETSQFLPKEETLEGGSFGGVQGFDYFTEEGDVEQARERSGYTSD